MKDASEEKDGYKKIAQGINDIVVKCRKQYGDKWPGMRARAREQLQRQVTSDLNERSVALATAMQAMDENNEDLAVVLVAAAYDPEKS